MQYKTHATFGAVLAGAAMLATGHGFMPFVALAGAFGAILPDIDHDKAKVSNMNFAFRVVGIVYRVFLRVGALFLRLVSRFLGLFGLKMATTTGGHRGPLTHSLVAVGIFALLLLPVSAISAYWYAGMVLGVLSHVLIDSLNPQGTPILWPLSVKHRSASGAMQEFRMHLLPAFLSPTTGTFGETIVLGLCVVALVLVVSSAAHGAGFGFMDVGRLLPQLGLPRGPMPLS